MFNKCVGVFMLVAPFAAMFVLVAHHESLDVAVRIFGGTTLFIGSFLIGIGLLAR